MSVPNENMINKIDFIYIYIYLYVGLSLSWYNSKQCHTTQYFLIKCEF